MKTKTILALLAGIIGFAGTAHAAYTFNFTIVGSSGTLTGVLTLNDAGTTATSLRMLSETSSNFDFIQPLEFDYVSDASVYANAFAVTGGAITSASFDSVSFADDYVEFMLNQNGYNGSFTMFEGELVNTGGFSGATYTNVSAPSVSAVPEPSSQLALLALGSAGLLTRRRMERKA
ncbi:MAG: hypothetical protein RLZZ214_2134 [Verrucomicrobiota bacterium]